MDLLKSKNSILNIDGISLKKLALKKTTPFYLYSANQIKKNVLAVKKALGAKNNLVCFAIKSNSNLNIIKEYKEYGIGADVVSLGELKLALKAGINAKKIVFSGVGKTSEELSYAISKNILLINCESQNEVELINKIANKKKKVVNIGIRINPDIKVKTNKKITTGEKQNKFGVSTTEFFRILSIRNNYKNINICGLSVHIGSQIRDLLPYKKLLSSLDKILIKLKKINFNLEYLDLGGGMAIPYFKNEKKFKINELGKLIKNFNKKNNLKLIFEIGRYLSGNIGLVISKVIYIKKIKDRYFIIIDAGMNDMSRSAIYEAYHEIISIEKRKGKFSKKIEFVGPICESSDTFGLYKNFSKLKEGDFVCITNSGAYGRSLSSNYNMRPLIEEIIIKNKKVQTIRKRQKIENIL